MACLFICCCGESWGGLSTHTPTHTRFTKPAKMYLCMLVQPLSAQPTLINSLYKCVCVNCLILTINYNNKTQPLLIPLAFGILMLQFMNFQLVHQICDLLFACIWWGWDDVNLGNDFTHSQAEVKRVQSKASAERDTLSFTEGFKVHQHSVQRNFSFEQFSWFPLWSCSSKMKINAKLEFRLKVMLNKALFDC